MRQTVLFLMIVIVVITTAVSFADKEYFSDETFKSNIESLRLAIDDLMQTFGDQYPDGQFYLDQLESIDEDGFEALQRRALLTNPLISGQPLLYVARAPDTQGTHLYLERDEAFQKHGSALKILEVGTGRTKTIVETNNGIIRNPCVHFDGHRILFSMSCDEEELFNIYEFDLKSSKKKPRQLTSASDVSDVDPIYLPDDSIVFSSSRDLKYVPCDSQIVPQLFRMNSDGQNIHQITRSTAHENQISLMSDGRILYSRWDYIDRNFGDGHGFWVTNPDGTNQALIWKNNTSHPSTGWTARKIPEKGSYLCILGTHHGSLGGALAIIDPRLDIEGVRSIVRTWPAEVLSWLQSAADDPPQEVRLNYFMAIGLWSPPVQQQWRNDINMRVLRHVDALDNVEPWYNTPWPLSDKYFLCVRAEERFDRPTIYLLDVFGNEVMVHEDSMGCASPMPLAPNPRPAMIPSRRDYGNGDGVFFVENVYEGTHMEGVKFGTVKKIRVVEAFSKRGLSPETWTGSGDQSPGVNWLDFNTKQILGTVPVESDGSAHFAVPCDRFVYFQLLDENDMMVQTMRSGTSIHSGEKMSCVGCHESRSSSSLSKSLILAAKRTPSKLQPWFGPPRPFSYQKEIQPIFDRYCIQCHDFDKKGADSIILAGDRNPSFNASYMELWKKCYVGGIGAGPAANMPAKSWGSHVSPLIRLLKEGHKDVELDDESMNRLITWVDLNGPYYPTTLSTYPESRPGRCPLNDVELTTLGWLTGFNFNDEELTSAQGFTRPQISFDRPELSPCLKSLEKDSGKYRQALALIRKGQERLRERPRADMPGFVPWEEDLQRMAHVEKYSKIEADSREAIRKSVLKK
ncbi:MAG: HzsA-related protein [Planctomycetota bacterium]|jgi:hypothetical protein